VVEREIGMEQLDGVLPSSAVVDVADQDILVTAAERSRVLRRSARASRRVRLPVEHANDPVLAAIELLGDDPTAPVCCRNARPRRSCRRSGAS